MAEEDKKKRKEKGSKSKVNSPEENISSIGLASKSTTIQKSISEFIEHFAATQLEDDEVWTWESYSNSKEIVTDEENAEDDTQKIVEKGKVTKKKQSKKARLAKEMAEKAIVSAKKVAGERSRLRHLRELRAGIDKEKREITEQVVRHEQLNSSIAVIESIKKHNVNKALRDRKLDEWNEYLKCDGLPNPYDCGEMNTYLHLWENDIENTTMAEATERTRQVLKLLDKLTLFIDDPVGSTKRQIENWEWFHCLFREYQQRSLDVATYRILRDITKNMHRINIKTYDFHQKEDNFILCIWLQAKLPKALPNPRTPPRPRININFPEMDLTVVFPEEMDPYCMTVRTTYVKYDHLSDLCWSSVCPLVPDQYNKVFENFNKCTVEEWTEKLIYKYEQYCNIKKTADPLFQSETIDREAGIIPKGSYQILYPSASIYVISEEDTFYRDLKRNLTIYTEKNVLNLRKYKIIGGVYSLNLCYQPPQEIALVTYNNIAITGLEVPKSFKEVALYIPYKPHPPIDKPETLTSEQTEAEQKKRQDELDELILITVKLPQHVIWLTTPTVCLWNRRGKHWTTVNIHNEKYNLESDSVSFYTEIVGSFAMAIYKFSNMPYQTWEMKPESNGTVTIQLTTAILSIEFNVKEDQVCVAQLKNVPINALKDIIKKYHKLPQLIRILQERGLDVFPDLDSICYIEGNCEKHWQMEKHLYYNIAQLCLHFNFLWSRWNANAGRRTIVLQMRECKSLKLLSPYQMLMVTPLRAAYIECTETSEEYSDAVKPELPMYADLNNLIKGTCAMTLKAKIQNVSPVLIGTLAKLLIKIRVLSFS